MEILIYDKETIKTINKYFIDGFSIDEKIDFDILEYLEAFLATFDFKTIKCSTQHKELVKQANFYIKDAFICVETDNKKLVSKIKEICSNITEGLMIQKDKNNINKYEIIDI